MDVDRWPSFDCGDRRLTLPLCDSTALEISRALLCRQGDSRRELKHPLRLDPIFAVWCVCAADGWFAELPTLDEVAGWFLCHGQRRFSIADGRQPSLEQADELEQAREVEHSFLEMIEISLNCASHAAQAAGGDGQQADRSYLLGLLSEASTILAQALGGDATPGDCRRLLPEWLSTLLRDLQSQGELAQHSPPSHVRGARAAIAAGTAPPDALVRRAVQRFQQSIPAASGLLAQCCQTTGRLRELENEFQATLEREKLASLKQLAYGASHEINNPLANISTRAQTLLHGEKDPERRRQLASINGQAFRAHEMIADMMLFAHPPQLQVRETKIGALIESSVDGARDDARQQGTQLSCEIADGLPEVVVDPVQLAVALKALLRNAIEALGAGGRVLVSARRADPPSVTSAAALEICVADDGPGITADVRRHLFDPFYSGREAGRGLGFGLAKCWRIIELHGGTILVDSQPGQGASLTVRLPVEPCRIHEAISHIPDGDSRSTFSG